MPEYLSPGVYIQEVNTGTRPIEGVGTAMAAFVGFAPAGPTNTPVLVTNWSQYVDTFGATRRRAPQSAPQRRVSLARGLRLFPQRRRPLLRRARRCARTATARSADDARLKVEPQRPIAQIPGRSAKALPSITATPEGHAGARHRDRGRAAHDRGQRRRHVHAQGEDRRHRGELRERHARPARREIRRRHREPDEQADHADRVAPADRLLDRTPQSGTYTLKVQGADGRRVDADRTTTP